MKLRFPATRSFTLVGLALLLPAGLAWAQTYSHVRMVRLSFVEGEVTVQRPDVQDWAAAPVNLPVSEGFKLATGENGFAEVEFEDTSTARLGQLSQLEFNQLMLSSEGQQVNSLTLQQGYATFRSKGHVQLFEVRAGNAAFVAQGSALFRVDLQEGQLRVMVFKGEVQVTDPAYSGLLAENQVLTLVPGDNPPYQIAQGITRDAWDEWVEQRESQAVSLEARRPQGAYSNNVTDLLYGMTDLDSYGMWTNLPGYGNGWIPRVGAGWVPFSQGRWCWYPGVGYTWISGEPWGWLPFHYGSWVYDPSFGWGWLPLPAYMGAWSPGRVTWYQGPGWIGWAPQAAGRHQMPRHCFQTGNCGTAVTTDAFQGGRFVNPHERAPVDFSQGARVDRPDVTPNPLLVLPGLPVNWPAGAAGRRVVPPVGQFGPGQTGSGAAAGAASATTPTSPAGTTAGNPRRPHGIPAQRGPVAAPGIAFDPVTGQFVNNPNRVPAAGAGQMPATLGNIPGSVTSRPAQLPTSGVQSGSGATAAQPPAPRGPFPGEIGMPRARQSGSAPAGGTNSRQGNQNSGTQGSGASPKNPPTGTWGAPRPPDRPAAAPPSPRPSSTPSGPSGGMAPRSSPGQDMPSSGSGHGGWGSVPTHEAPSGAGAGNMPSSPSGPPTGTFGGGHGGGSDSGSKPSR